MTEEKIESGQLFRANIKLEADFGFGEDNYRDDFSPLSVFGWLCEYEDFVCHVFV